MNHSAMGLATVVDSLVAIRELVFAADAELSLSQLREALAANWAGHEDTRRQIRTELPRYGRDDEDTRALARTVGEMWVAEVARASEGMDRLAMWPAFYSHIVHVHHGRDTGATPDGRLAGEPLSENQNPSAGTVGCSPTTVLSAMADLPVDRTPSGACTMTLSPRDLTGGLLLSLLESYFQMGGLHMHVTVVDPVMLRAAQAHPEEHRDLMVRVAGFNGYFVRCAPHVQADVLRRYLS